MSTKIRKFNIVITDFIDYSDYALSIYRKIGNVKIISSLKKVPDLQNTEILIVWLKSRIGKAEIDSMPGLKIIASPTTGLNHIDVDYATLRGIKIINLKNKKRILKNVSSTAELAFGLIIAASRNMVPACLDVREGVWDNFKWRGTQLRGKTLGIIGFGRLGRMMAKFGKSFGMSILANDPYIPPGVFKRFGVTSVSLTSLLKKSDIISLHVDLRKNNHSFINSFQFKQMRKTPFLVNTSRGELVNESSLLSALKKRVIRGAAIDVMNKEGAKGEHLINNPLVEYAKNKDNLIILPHIGGTTEEAMETTQDYIAEQISNYIRRSFTR